MMGKSTSGQFQKHQYLKLIKHLSIFALIIIITFMLCVTEEFTFIIDFRRHQSKAIVKKLFLKGNGDFSSTDDWRQVTPFVYVYSAYWDNRIEKKPIVRIIVGAKIPYEHLDSVKCLLMMTSNVTFEVDSYHEEIPETHFRNASPHYVNCLVTSKWIPQFVALVPSNWSHTSSYSVKWITIRNRRPKSVPHGIGVCVRPFFKYIDSFRVTEFVAYYEALGVKHFTFYDYFSFGDTKTLFSELKKQSYSLDLLPWTFPKELEEMWEMGQLANINDCLYRNMYDVEYIAIVDLDEFITPRHVLTLPELLKQQEKSGNFASFVIRSSIFCMEYQKDDFTPPIPPFITQTHIRREDYIYPFNVRSKYIVKPKGVLMGGVHYALRIEKSWNVKYVQASKVLLHHYRANLCANYSERNTTSTIDVTSRKYLNLLMRSRAINVWADHFKEKTSTSFK